MIFVITDNGFKCGGAGEIWTKTVRFKNFSD